MEEIIEETKENPEVPETTAEETPEENQEEERQTPKEESPEQYTEREKRYYARMKQAEAEAKKFREETEKAKRAYAPKTGIDEILEVQEATKDLTGPEISELKLRADALKVPLTEARKDQNFVLWQKAFKDKVEKEKSALPSTTVGNVSKTKSLADMDIDERTKLFKRMGLVTERANPMKPAE